MRRRILPRPCCWPRGHPGKVFGGQQLLQVIVVTAIAGWLAAPPAAASAVEARTELDYGYIFMQREDACLHEELWTGLNVISTATLAPGSSWSDPTASVWAWYRSTNECTSEETTVYGDATLTPDQFDLQKLDDLRFETHLELHEVEASEPPPFLLSGPSGLATNLWGTVHIALVFTQEGSIATFNSMNGIPIPPPPGTHIGAPGQRVPWRYTGASVAGSVSGDVEFDLDSVVFAEIGALTMVEA